MAEAWLPGAIRVRADTDGGRLGGGAPRVIWQTTERDPHGVAARSAAHDLNRVDAAPHLVWNPVSGDLVQLVPITRAASGPVVATVGGLHANRQGRVCVQVAVIGFASVPFTSGPLRGLATIMRWLDTWGVPRGWPAGAPTGRIRAASLRHWAQGGHFGCSQVPGARHAGPGPIDVRTIAEFDVAVPRPRAGRASEAPARLVFRT